MKIDHKPDRPVRISAADGRDTAFAVQMLATFGTTSQDFSNRILNELLEAGCRGTNSKPFQDVDVNGALAAIHGIAPTDEIEAMLAAEMVAVHSAAMRCLQQLKGSEIIPQQDSSGNIAVKLLRTYVMQMEALQRHRGKGEQKMTVQHVHVHEGGQAIVGEVNAARAGDRGSEKTEGQPHAITHAPGQTLPSALQAHREAVPGAGR